VSKGQKNKVNFVDQELTHLTMLNISQSHKIKKCIW